MKDWHPKNGWLVQCVGGRADGLWLRMHYGENPDITDPPPEEVRMQPRNGERQIYRRHLVEGKYAKKAGVLYPKYQYLFDRKEQLEQ